jgi:hypothetical protein
LTNKQQQTTAAKKKEEETIADNSNLYYGIGLLGLVGTAVYFII